MGLFSSFFWSLFDLTGESRKRYRGASGEALNSVAMKLFLPGEYVILNNVTFPTPRGTTQIDHLVVSRFGIHVIESKNITGAIYGEATKRNWVVYLGGEKHTFYNPLLQNSGHIKALSAKLHLPERVFHSVVYFCADYCELKTDLPENVITSGLCDCIQEARQILIDPLKVGDIVAKIQQARLPENDVTDEAHVERLRDRFQRKHAAGETCPRCQSGHLVQRTAKETGDHFLGCSNYPRCKYTENL